MTIYLLSYSESAYSITLYVYIYMSPSVSIASRRITLSQRPLRDLCLLVFGATRLKETTNKITSEISMLEYPFGCWNQVNPTIFEICYFVKTSTITIHIRKLLMRNSDSAYLVTFINIWKHVSRFIFNFRQFVYFM